MAELPTGTVTFLFTDVEGSTRLLHELGDAYAEALGEHRRALRECFARHGGVEVDTQGDAFFVAFARASNALAAAAAARDALTSGPIRVRMGVHTGEPLVTDEGYVGIDVHRAARIAGAGHGGQILVSQSTRDLVDADSLRDLGEHRLKDLTAPERIFQLGDTEFPPLKSLNQTNLPVQPTPLVGRERELEEVFRLLSSSRLLTLTGAGGSGKTRLALQLAAEMLDEFPDGVWFVPLGAVAKPDLVLTTIASTVGTKEDLADFLRGRRVLLLLDNLEQLLPDVATQISELLVAPNLKVLATSRERLSLTAEQEYPVPILPIADAVELFTARARQLKPSFEPDEYVTQIAQRLDGLPLAIELAAARVKVLLPKQIAERLSHSLDFLTSGTRDAPHRQRTLRATIEWSYLLLDGNEQRVFARLAAFAGSFDIDAAEVVCAADLDTLQSLVDKSLLRQTEEGRFFLLETIRDFTSEMLHASGELYDVNARHAEHYAGVAADLGGSFWTGDQAALGVRFERDIYNLRNAIDHFVRSGSDGALRMVEGLWMYWLSWGRLGEGTLWAERALEAAPDAAPLLVADVTATLGEFARFGGDSARAVELKERALDRFRDLDEKVRVAATLHDLADVWAHEGDYARARKLSLEALEIRRGIGRPSGIAHALSTLGDVALFEGNLVEALQIYEELLELHSKDPLGDVYHVNLLFLRAECLRRQGASGRAVSVLKDAISLAARLNLRYFVPDILYTAAALKARSDPRRAAVLIGAAEAIREEAGLDYFDPAECERIVRLVREGLGETELTTARVFGAGLTLDAALGDALESLD